MIELHLPKIGHNFWGAVHFDHNRVLLLCILKFNVFNIPVIYEFIVLQLYFNLIIVTTA